MKWTLKKYLILFGLVALVSFLATWLYGQLHIGNTSDQLSLRDLHVLQAEARELQLEHRLAKEYHIKEALYHQEEENKHKLQSEVVWKTIYEKVEGTGSFTQLRNEQKLPESVQAMISD